MGMLIWLVTHAAQTKTPRVATLAAPTTRAETAFWPVVGSGVTGLVAGVAEVRGRVTVAVAMSFPPVGSPDGRFEGNSAALRFRYIIVLNTSMHWNPVVYRVACVTPPGPLRSEP